MSVYATPEHAHKAAIKHIVENGHTARGTTEKLGQSFSMRAPSIDTLFVPRPGADHRIGIVEGCQLVAGEAWPEVLGRYGRLGQFMDGQIFAGAYGPRIEKPIDWVITELLNEWDSRRAVASIWRPDDGYRGEASNHDIPCTLNIQFITVGERVDMIVTMRSSDLWWGWTYDLVQFAILHASVSFALNGVVGIMTIMAGSLHIYDQHFKRAVEYANTPLTDEAKAMEEVPKHGYVARCEASHRRLPPSFSDGFTPGPFTSQRAGAHRVLQHIADRETFIEGASLRDNPVTPWLQTAVNDQFTEIKDGTRWWR